VQIFIEKIVNGGYGIGRKNGRVYLVPYAVPGDLLELHPSTFGEQGKDGTPFGEIVRIVEPSPLRAQPRCPVFGLCGGCDYDHMSYQYELTVKRDVLLEDLHRIAGMAREGVKVLRSPSEYGYRNHAYVRLDGAGRPGFFMKRSHRVVAFPREGCLLLDRRLNEIIAEMPQPLPMGQGALRIRSNLQGEVFCKGVPGKPVDRRARYQVRDLEFEIGIDDFFQVNNLLNDRWVQSIEDNLDPEPDDRLLDLFCGSGLIALSLARSLGSVAGIEANGNAVRNARLNAGRNGVQNASFFLRDLTQGVTFESLVPAGTGPLKVVADPPRTGIAGPVIESIARLNPSVIIYASCSSATFARDLGLFRSCGYGMERLMAIDMFPRTHHLEMIARLVPAGTEKL
jgi:23S rRNA (uracil1939-C5)-methyltransferase